MGYSIELICDCQSEECIANNSPLLVSVARSTDVTYAISKHLAPRAESAGWVRRKGEWYCPACAVFLGLSAAMEGTP